MRMVWIVLLTVGLLSCGGSNGRNEGLSAEAQQYVRSLALSEMTIQATENALGGVLVEVNGSITNNGSRTVENATVACTFTEPYGQPLKTETVTLLRSALKPGETRTFRLPFENIPEGWNQAMPQVRFVGIRFAS